MAQRQGDSLSTPSAAAAAAAGESTSSHVEFVEQHSTLQYSS